MAMIFAPRQLYRPIERIVHALFCVVVGLCSTAVAAATLSVGDVVNALAGLREGNRNGAIANFARSGQLPNSIGATDGAAILQGTTQGARAGAIGELANLFKGDLSGKEAETILGPESTLSEGYRQTAISALARAKRFGPSLGEDSALSLKGVTQAARAGAISEIAPYLSANLPGQAIATILGSGTILSEANRQIAITSIARSGKKPLPLGGPDGAAILQGSSQGARAGAIIELAPLFKPDLTGQDAALILGSGITMSEVTRQNAITALARARRFGPSLAEDAALMLEGTTQGNRAGSIGEIATYLRQGLSGQQLAAILGDSTSLTESNRQNAIAALARAGRVRQCISALELSLLMVGTRQGSRANAIGEAANFANPILHAEDLAKLLGTGEELSERSRTNAIAALVRSGAVGRSFNAKELDAILEGTTGEKRIFAIAELNTAKASSAQKASACSKEVATNSGSVSSNASRSGNGTSVGVLPSNGAVTPTGSTGVNASDIQKLIDRIARLRKISNNVDPYAFGLDTVVDQINVVAMDLPRMIGLKDFRALYDQNYFGALQYRIVANRTLDRAQTALRVGNTTEAQRQADRATTLIQQERDSFSAAQAALDRDAARATTYVRLVYETSKAMTSVLAKLSHNPGATSAVDALWAISDAGISASEDGLSAGEKTLVADVITKVAMKYVPIDVLGGKTIENVLDGTAGKLVSDTGIRAAVRNQMTDPAMRKTVVIAVTQGVSDAISKPFDAKFQATIEHAIAGMQQ